MQTTNDIIVNVNEDGAVELHDGITMELEANDGDVIITLDGIDVPDGESWLEWCEYEFENGYDRKPHAIEWLASRGVRADYAEAIADLMAEASFWSAQ